MFDWVLRITSLNSILSLSSSSATWISPIGMFQFHQHQWSCSIHLVLGEPKFLLPCGQYCRTCFAVLLSGGGSKCSFHLFIFSVILFLVLS
jgi:hypothetical protein